MTKAKKEKEKKHNTKSQQPTSTTYQSC